MYAGTLLKTDYLFLKFDAQKSLMGVPYQTFNPNIGLVISRIHCNTLKIDAYYMITPNNAGWRFYIELEKFLL